MTLTTPKPRRSPAVAAGSPVVAFLQNAWSSEMAGRHWPREDWLSALHASRSGQRIRTVESLAKLAVWWDNTTPEVGDNPDSVLPPDRDHITRVLVEQRPTAVLAMGKQAAAVVAELWDGPLLVVPHPTYRVVTNRLYAAAGRLLAGGLEGRWELQQLRGRFRKARLADREST
jgi:hypothetical protein